MASLTLLADFLIDNMATLGNLLGSRRVNEVTPPESTLGGIALNTLVGIPEAFSKL